MAELNIGQESLPISRVNLNVDSDTYYTAGDDTGRIIECECPWGTQAMADDILASLRGYIYKPFEGNDALLDPAAELGDTIDVGGFHGVISMLGRNLDRQSAATVGAPGVDEIEDEYPYKSLQRRREERLLATTRSLITKTAEEITLSVEGLSGDFSQLKVSLEGVSILDEDGNITQIRGDAIDTGTLNVSFADVSGRLKSNRIDLYSDLTVYTDSTLKTAGGRLGFAMSDIDETSVGMHMISASDNAEVIVTDSGARMHMINEVDGNSIVSLNQMWVAVDSAGIECAGTKYLEIYGGTDTVVLRGGTWDFTEVETVDFTDVTVLGLTAAGTTAVFA